MVESEMDRKAKMQQMMRVAQQKFKEFSEAILDVEYGSREEWQTNYELQASERFIEMSRVDAKMSEIVEKVGNIESASVAEDE